jgi:uncharacterized protein (TIGR02302 family)
MIELIRRVREALREAREDGERVLGRRVVLAKLILIFERVWRALLWPFLVAGCFLVVSLIGIWGMLPLWAHSVGLFAFALAFAFALVPLLRIPMPSREDGLRRLERDSGVRHRPATSFEDRLPDSASAATQTLWRRHRERLARLVATLRPRGPRPGIARLDPYAIRALVLLLIVSTAFIAGRGGWDRLAAAFTYGSDFGSSGGRLDVWVTPPLYTGSPPVVLADGKGNRGNDDADRPVTVPEGSQLMVRVNGAGSGRSALEFVEGESGGRESAKPSARDEQLAEYKFTLRKPGRAKVSTGGTTLGAWNFNIIDDRDPTIRLVEPPGATPRKALRLHYQVDDDYGVAHAEARFELAGKAGPNGAAGEQPASAGVLIEPPLVPLRLPRTGGKETEGRTFKDLSSHPWAGLRVRMRLVARDQAGQEGTSPPYILTLPAREFQKPLARAIIEQRRNLVRRRGAREQVAQALQALTVAPERFIQDKVVYLGLRSAYWRLKIRDDRQGLTSVVDQLWEIALRIEDGDLSDAERALRMAQERLMKALEEGASDDEINRLVQELRTSLGRFLNALAEQARRNGMKPGQEMGANRLMNSQDLDQMLRQIQDLAKTGSREMAQRLLSELRDLLERLQMGMAGGDPRGEQMMNMMDGLGDLIMRQQKLLDETFELRRQQQRAGRQQGPGEGQRGEMPGRQGQGPGPQGRRPGRQGQDGSRQPGQGPQGSGGLASRQGRIQQSLEQLMEQLRGLGANPSEKLEGAGQAMGNAQTALGEEKLDRATHEETRALDRLRQGAQSLAEQIMQMMSAQMGRSGQDGRDPLGRPDRSSGPDLGSSVKVPDEIDIQRAREILDELRRRLSEPNRPMLELDYLERLIRRF